MKEVTRIFTVEITAIGCVKEEEDILEKEEAAKKISRNITGLLGADAAVVTNVQDFIRDKEERDEQREHM